MMADFLFPALSCLEIQLKMATSIVFPEKSSIIKINRKPNSMT